MRVLVISQKQNRGALVAARELAALGWVVGSGSADRGGSLVARSRAVSYRHAVPPPQVDLDAYLGSIAAAVEQVGYDVVLAGSDADTLALSYGRDRITTGVCYPSHDSVVAVFDKLMLSEAAGRYGLGTPDTRELTERTLDEIAYPVVVKSRLHWRPGAPHFHWRTTICSDRAEARIRGDQIREGGGEPLLQEVVDGRLLHYQVVLDRDGRLLAATAQRSEPDVLPPYTYPPVVGTRVRSLSVVPSPEVLDPVTRLLRDVGWVGFASVMFMEAVGGEPLLVDFNGRIPNSFQQTVAACPDVLERWVRSVAGVRGLPAARSRIGVRFQWVEGDLRRAIRERRGGLVADLSDVAAFGRGVDHGMFTWRDPAPALVYWRQLASSALDRKDRTRRGRGGGGSPM